MIPASQYVPADLKKLSNIKNIKNISNISNISNIKNISNISNFLTQHLVGLHIGNFPADQIPERHIVQREPNGVKQEKQNDENFENPLQPEIFLQGFPQNNQRRDILFSKRDIADPANDQKQDKFNRDRDPCDFLETSHRRHQKLFSERQGEGLDVVREDYRVEKGEGLGVPEGLEPDHSGLRVFGVVVVVFVEEESHLAHHHDY